ncbi:MAG: diacylglycerol/lipid kinase family protein [Acidimicrobiales bacterium]
MTARRLLRPALGAAVLASMLRLFRWRRHRRGPAEVRESRQLELEPNPTGAGMSFAVNPNAGSAGSDLAAELREALPDAEVVELDDPGDLEKVLDAAAGRPGTRAIGAAGGDGTMSWAASIAAEHGLPLVAVSGGTLNHLAADLGLDDVADTVAAVAAGQAVEVDLPTIDGRPFLNTASFGSYAELVDARELLEDRIGKWPALVVAGVRVLRHGTPIEVDLDGEPHRSWMIFIGNCRYKPDGFAPSRRSRLDDGQLDIRIIDAGHPFSRTRLVLGLATGRLGRSPVYRQWAATSLVVSSSDGPLRLACDGETFDGGEAVEVLKAGGRVTIYSPVAGPDT